MLVLLPELDWLFLPFILAFLESGGLPEVVVREVDVGADVCAGGRVVVVVVPVAVGGEAATASLDEAAGTFNTNSLKPMMMKAKS